MMDSSHDGGSGRSAPRLQRFAVAWLCLVAALVGVERGQIAEAGQRIWMAGPEYLAARLQCLPKERLRLTVAALVSVERGQVVEVDQCIRMAWPEQLAPGLPRFPTEWLCLAVTALDLVEKAQVVEAGQGLRLAVANVFRDNASAYSARFVPLA
jgi:hypothetical protein